MTFIDPARITGTDAVIDATITDVRDGRVRPVTRGAIAFYNPFPTMRAEDALRALANRLAWIRAARLEAQMDQALVLQDYDHLDDLVVVTDDTGSYVASRWDR